MVQGVVTQHRASSSSSFRLSLAWGALWLCGASRDWRDASRMKSPDVVDSNVSRSPRRAFLPYNPRVDFGVTCTYPGYCGIAHEPTRKGGRLKQKGRGDNNTETRELERQECRRGCASRQVSMIPDRNPGQAFTLHGSFTYHASRDWYANAALPIYR